MWFNHIIKSTSDLSSSVMNPISGHFKTSHHKFSISYPLVMSEWNFSMNTSWKWRWFCTRLGSDLHEPAHVHFSPPNWVQNHPHFHSLFVQKSFINSASESSYCSCKKSQPMSDLLYFQFEFLSSDDRSDLLPHLEFNANNTQVSLTLNNILSAFHNSRFALQLAMITSDGLQEKMSLRTVDSIDDEHSPGVFQVVHFLTS